MSKRDTIYVALLDEGIDVWRPVEAQKVSSDTYLIVDQDYDPRTERWEFEPGNRRSDAARRAATAARFWSRRKRPASPRPVGLSPYDLENERLKNRQGRHQSWLRLSAGLGDGAPDTVGRTGRPRGPWWCPLMRLGA